VGLIARSLLNVTEDRPLRLLLVPFQTDAICGAWDYEIIDLHKGCELVLEGVIS
jgi:hypothetical protein